jgi:quinolinate synthase
VPVCVLAASFPCRFSDLGLNFLLASAYCTAVGDKYTEFEGYKNDTETRIVLSYANLCKSVKAGNRILIADGTIVIVVKEIVSDTSRIPNPDPQAVDDYLETLKFVCET